MVANKSDLIIQGYKKSKLKIDIEYFRCLPAKLKLKIVEIIEDSSSILIDSKKLDIKKLKSISEDIRIINFILFVTEYSQTRALETKKNIHKFILKGKEILRCATGIPHYKCKKCGKVKFGGVIIDGNRYPFLITRHNIMRKEFNYCIDCDHYSEFEEY